MAQLNCAISFELLLITAHISNATSCYIVTKTGGCQESFT